MYPTNQPLANILKELLSNAGMGQHLMDNRGYINIQDMLTLPQFVELGITERDVISFASMSDTYLKLSEYNLFLRWKHRNECTFPFPLYAIEFPHNSCSELQEWSGIFRD